MKRLYAALAVVGYIASNWFVIPVSVRTGNVLLWTKPWDTIAGMFANPISTAFAVDLLFAALVACIWFHAEGRRLGMRRIPMYWLLTLAFGLAGTLPLYLYHRESRLQEILADRLRQPLMREHE